MNKSDAVETDKERRKRLGAMTEEEWHAASQNFWRWFNKVKSWEDAHEEEPSRPNQPSRN